MGFTPGISKVSDLSDVVLNNPSSAQALTYDTTVSKWKNADVLAGATGASPGTIYFDDFFDGVNDSAKMTSLNTWAQAQSGPTPAVVFAARQYNFNVPIKLFSGLKLVGGTLSPAREFSRATTLNWQGGTGSSMFIFPPEGQTGQSYPADGSPRDISVSYIQLQGGASTHCMPKYDPTSGQYNGHTLWYCQFHACGFKNFSTVWWGWGTGCSISGQTHFQAVGDTALYLGGSENSIFGRDAYSMAGSGSDTGVPFLRSIMGKSYIGMVMFTTRKVSPALSIEGGYNMAIDGMAIDAQSSDPIYGAGLRITGGEAITVTNCSFKGMATSPSLGYGGASANKGWIHVSGGDQIIIQSNTFRREGTNLPATSYPLVHVEADVPDGAVRWGYNGYSNFGSSVVQIQQAAANKIVAATDPRVNVVIGA